tara:strand:- start:371 stop:652 length:282 start_codon:yes stop_codon:yes gene_type:complete
MTWIFRFIRFIWNNWNKKSKRVIEYTYHNRGRCVSCEKIIWNTATQGSILCSCTVGVIHPTTSSNVSTITDEAFKEALREEFTITGDIILRKI